MIIKPRLPPYILVILVVIVFLCSYSYLETGTELHQFGNNRTGALIVEHKYVFELFESKYDARIWVNGSDVFTVEGARGPDLDRYLIRYLNPYVNPYENGTVQPDAEFGNSTI
ncbi:hypothetical protein [Methanogenium organophilum]|uniref:Uncharacterized protein n=1 Tax=Methanogenium organophilum TaxID=2199 RepID=A0A9X9S5U7_METOG|nr:hypothetical protein [Methanogenium organophilum]WAI02236.1 hypothetical protein OU421_05030 [Methanogenium organophilum]